MREGVREGAALGDVPWESDAVGVTEGVADFEGVGDGLGCT